MTLAAARRPEYPTTPITGSAMRFSQRVQSLPPYLFAGIERKIAERRAAGADVISLGIGDPDLPTPPHIVRALAEGAADPATHQYPSNQGELAFREAVAGYYATRFGVALDPATQVMPLLGAKEGIAHIGLVMLDQADVALATDPGYPVYTTGPLLADGTTVLLPLEPELGFQPDLDAIEPSVLAKAKMIFVSYPNNPTGAVIEDDFFVRLVAFAREHDLLVVHDNAYADITYDGYVAPSFLQTPGALDVGVEMFSLSKSYNMTGWRSGALVGNTEVVDAFWRLKTNMDSGMFGGCAARQRGGAHGPAGLRARDVRRVRAAAGPARRGAARRRHAGAAAQGHHLPVGARARGLHVGRLHRAGAGAGGRHRHAGRGLRPHRRGLRPPLAHRARRAPARSRAAHRGAGAPLEAGA